MIRPRLAAALTTIFLLVAGAAAWAIRHEGTYTVVENRLGEFPSRVLDYAGRDHRLEDSVYAVLGNDYNLLRRYEDGLGRSIWLYVGYYGTAKGGRPRHVPQACYTGQGFSIEDWRRVAAPAGHGKGKIHQMIVKRQDERQFVLFWFQNQGDRILSDGVEQNLLRLQSRVAGSRDDGSLVRLSMPIEPGRDQAALQELSRFAAEVIRLLPMYWPIEAKVQAAR
jgi:EpsI family protein